MQVDSLRPIDESHNELHHELGRFSSADLCRTLTNRSDLSSADLKNTVSTLVAAANAQT